MGEFSSKGKRRTGSSEQHLSDKHVCGADNGAQTRGCCLSSFDLKTSLPEVILQCQGNFWVNHTCVIDKAHFLLIK